MAVVTLDSRGRVTLPKEIRDKLGGARRFKIHYVDGRVVLEPLGSVADRFYGAFKPRRPVPSDLDEAVAEAVEEEWRGKHT